MAANGNGGWKTWALAGLTGLVLGGGGGGLVGAKAANEVENRLVKQLDEQKVVIEQLRQEKDDNFGVILEMSVAIARIEAKVDQLSRER